jgi:hypothetical protein
MRKKIQKVSFLLLSGMLLLGVLPMQSQSTNLYVYGTDGSKQSFSLDEVRKLTFTATELVINKQSGDPVSVLFTDLRCFSLKDDLYTGIATPKAVAEISVYPSLVTDQVTVTNAKTITGFSLYNLQGQQLLQLAPESQEVTVSLASYPAGVYLLRIVDETGITTKKVIKK